MNPKHQLWHGFPFGIPRVSGGEPGSYLAHAIFKLYSPRERGNLWVEVELYSLSGIPRVSGGEPLFLTKMNRTF